MPPGNDSYAIQVKGINVSQETRAAAGSPLQVERRDKLGQRLMVLTVLAAVIMVDQAIKWLAWRHVSGAEINPGGDVLTGRTVGGWYADPVTGPLLDLLDFGLLSIAVSILVRRRRAAAVVVSGALILGGWGSNLLDRLGMHYWTAPGSVRGVVDFIPIGGARFNVADLFIIAATPLFLLAAGYLGWRAANRPTAVRAARNRLRARASMLAPAGAGPIAVAVTHDASHYGGVSTAPRTSARQAIGMRAQPWELTSAHGADGTVGPVIFRRDPLEPGPAA
jgi:lipoprotein signal peptidase